MQLNQDKIDYLNQIKAYTALTNQLAILDVVNDNIYDAPPILARANPRPIIAEELNTISFY